MNEREKYDGTLATASKKERAIYHITPNVSFMYIYSRTIRAKHKQRLEHARAHVIARNNSLSVILDNIIKLFALFGSLSLLCRREISYNKKKKIISYHSGNRPEQLCIFQVTNKKKTFILYIYVHVCVHTTQKFSESDKEWDWFARPYRDLSFVLEFW